VHIVTTNLHAYVCQQHNNTSALLLCHLQMRDYTNWAPMQTCTYHIMHLTTCHFINCCRVHVRPVHEAAGYLSTNLACSYVSRCPSCTVMYCTVLHCMVLHAASLGLRIMTAATSCSGAAALPRGAEAGHASSECYAAANRQ
jgi:hypothetical protein